MQDEISAGKALVAEAITNKGVATSHTATFETIASNIANIPMSASGTLGIAYSYKLGVRHRYDYTWYYLPKNTLSGTMTIVLENGKVVSQTNSGGTGSEQYYATVAATGSLDYGAVTSDFVITSVTWEPS